MQSFVLKVCKNINKTSRKNMKNLKIFREDLMKGKKC